MIDLRDRLAAYGDDDPLPEEVVAPEVKAPEATPRAKPRSPRHMANVQQWCGKHPLVLGATQCDRCHRGCCDRCTVPVRRRLLCIDCAMVLGGVSTRKRVS